MKSELEALARQGDQFRRIISPKKDDVLFDLCSFLEAFDIRTAYPLLLALADAGLDDVEWKAVSSVLESYLLRRAVCNLGTKNYNRIFLSLTRALSKEGFSADKLKTALLMQSGESGVWPDDATFKEAWLNRPLYGPLNSPKLVHLYGRLNQTFMSNKAETGQLRRSTVDRTYPAAELASELAARRWVDGNGLSGAGQSRRRQQARRRHSST